MIVSLLQTNIFNRYFINHSPPRFFVIRDSLYFHNCVLIQDQLLTNPTLKPRQEPLLTNDSFYQYSKLLSRMPGKSPPYLLLQLTHIFLHHHPHQDISTPTLTPLIFVLGGTNRKNKQQVISWWVVGASSLESDYFYRLFIYTKPKQTVLNPDKPFLVIHQ